MLLSGIQWRKGFSLFAISIFMGIFSQGLAYAAAIDGPNIGSKPDKSNRALSEAPLQFNTPKDKENFYSAIVREMYSTIYSRHPRSLQDLGSWTNVLMQGGSIEGIYHGLILSNEYSELERGTASLRAVRFFAEESARDQAQSAGDKIAKPGVAEGLVKRNLNSPLFTLKRLLGENILLQLNARKGDREKLATWYSKIVIRWNGLGVPFGKMERVNMDDKFHHDWAMTHSIGLIQWELLYRVHRIMNEFGGVFVSE